jgi:hypothetical protein
LTISTLINTEEKKRKMEGKKSESEEKGKIDDNAVLTRGKSLKNAPPPPYIPAEISSAADLASKPCEDTLKESLENFENLTVSEKKKPKKKKGKKSKNGKIVQKEVEGKHESGDETESDKGKFSNYDDNIDDDIVVVLLSYFLFYYCYH